MKQSSRAGDIILALFFYVPVVWGALLIAQSLGRGLPELLTNLTAALQHPLDIHWTDKSLLSILILSLIHISYGWGVCSHSQSIKNKSFGVQFSNKHRVSIRSNLID